MAKGKKTGGRVPGSVNKRIAAKASAIALSGLTPLDYMLGVMRNDKAGMLDRLEAAKAAAPYIHRRLAAIEHTGANNGPIEVISKVQRDAAVRAALRADT